MHKRIIIHPSDVVILTGRSESYARRLLREIRQKLGKPARSLITVKEFCDYTQLNEKEVREVIV